MMLFALFFLHTTARVPPFPVALPLPQGQVPMGPFDTFNIMGPDFVQASKRSNPDFILLDGLSFEWDYFMVHVEDPETGKPVFDGMVCIVLMDPRGRFDNTTSSGNALAEHLAKLVENRTGVPAKLPLQVLPIGSNAVFVGKWADEKIMPLADFVNFPRHLTSVSACNMSLVEPLGPCSVQNTRTVKASKTDQGDCRYGCSLDMSVEGNDAIRFTGETKTAAWDLYVTQDWSDRPPVSTKLGTDWSKPHLQGEFFSVHMPWLRTNINGTIRRRLQNGTLDAPLHIENGHGYRENSWGQWAFTVDGGWDFAIFSNNQHDSHGVGNVQWAWQSYFHEENGQLDNLDVSWCEGDLNVTSGKCGNLVTVSYGLADFTWSHPGTWTFDTVASQCKAADALVVGEHARDKGYRVSTYISIKDSQTPILAPTLTNIFYVIYEWLPTVTGTIEQCEEKCDNEYCWCEWRKILDFNGTAGGELALQKQKSYIDSLIDPFKKPKILDDASCTEWGRVKFSSMLRPRQ